MESESAVSYRIHKNPPLVPILNQKTQSAPLRPISFRLILMLSHHLHIGLSTTLFP
jgi:hypothetical protein